MCVKDCGLHNQNIDIIILFACLVGWYDYNLNLACQPNSMDFGIRRIGSLGHSLLGDPLHHPQHYMPHNHTHILDIHTLLHTLTLSQFSQTHIHTETSIETMYTEGGGRVGKRDINCPFLFHPYFVLN